MVLLKCCFKFSVISKAAKRHHTSSMLNGGNHAENNTKSADLNVLPLSSNVLSAGCFACGCCRQFRWGYRSCPAVTTMGLCEGLAGGG